MKRIFLMLLVLVVGMIAFGSVIVVYAHTPHVATVMPTPTSLPLNNWVDRQATVEPQIRSSVISQGNADLLEVALTFDDGPSPLFTPQILAILQKYNVHATFFTVGENVQNYPDLVQQEQSAGNVVANHSWNHPDLTTLANTDIQTQLSNTSNVIQQAAGTPPTFFRPPYGAIDGKVLAQAKALGLTPVLWSVDTEDWQLPGSPAIVNTALSQTANGSIVLMHDSGGNRSQTVAALPMIIEGLQQRGYQLVTIQQLYNHMPLVGSTSTTTAA